MIRKRLTLPLLIPVALAAGVAAASLGACGKGEEAPRFDGELADSLVRRQLEFGPRVPGTEAHEAALAWMVEYLEARAGTVVVDSFTHVTAFGDTLRLANVLAHFRPEAPSRILLLAHWDSRPVAEHDPSPVERHNPVPGANDGASGVAVLLALAEGFHRQPPPVGVDILLTDGEDWGHDPVTLATVTDDMFLGARHFARTRAAGYTPLFAILLDMVGDRDPRFPYEGNSVAMAPEVVTRVWNAARDLGHEDVFVATGGPAVSDDHIPLNEAGIRTIDIIDFDYPPWHTTQDTADKVSAETLGIVGEVVLEVIDRQGAGGR